MQRTASMLPPRSAGRQTMQAAGPCSWLPVHRHPALVQRLRSDRPGRVHYRNNNKDRRDLVARPESPDHVRTSRKASSRREDDESPGDLRPQSPAAANAVPAPHAATPAAAPAAAAEADSYNYSPEFTRRRLVVFAGLVLGYTTFYLTRGSLTYSAPLLVADPALGLDIKAIGTMTSIFPMAYGVSKFVSGVLGAQFSARLLLGCGLMATAAVNIMFGASSALTAFCVLWGLNGMLQGVGAPTCATILTRWFASKERGTYWGMWNISHNLGGFLAPIIIGGTAAAFGWRWGMFVPGAIGMAIGLMVLATVRDRPQDCGFAAVDPGAAAAAAKPAAPQAAAGADKAAPATSASSGMIDAMKAVLRMPAIWALAFTYFFIYVVRQGVTSWLVFYLMAEKGAPDAASAALAVSGLELGGLAGSMVAGALSDRAIRSAGAGAGHVGKRVQVIMGYTVAMAGALLALKAVPVGAAALQWAAIAALGFAIYGPQMLIGLTGAELVAPGAVGASQGILGWIAYLGAANAGIPLSHVVSSAGWDGFFTALLGACGVALVLLTTVVNAQSYNQRQARAAAVAAA